MNELELLSNKELEAISGGKVNWGVAAGYCLSGALIGAAGGTLSAGVGCFIAGAQEISDGLFK